MPQQLQIEWQINLASSYGPGGNNLPSPPRERGKARIGAPHPDTASLPQNSPHRYPSPMEDATNRHSHDLAASALREAATPCPVPMVARVHDRTPSGKQKEGLLPTGKNFFGFIADTCHSSYRSNGKSTSLAATAPEETTSLHPPASGARLGSGRQHPATTSLPQHSPHRYPSPMEDATNRHSQRPRRLRPARGRHPLPCPNGGPRPRPDAVRQAKGGVVAHRRKLFWIYSCYVPQQLQIEWQINLASSYGPGGNNLPSPPQWVRPQQWIANRHSQRLAPARLTLPRALYAHAAHVDTTNGER